MPAVESSLDSRVASELLLALFQDYFNSERYQMRLADTAVALTMAENQIQLAVSGYSSGVGPALTRALSVLKKLVASDLVQLDFVSEFMLRRMQDSYNSMAPYQHAVEQVQQWLVPNRFTTLEKIDVLRNLTVSDVKSFAANLTGELSLSHQLGIGLSQSS
jgi:secreted Zn-dependent insulinase-like peptidase